MGNGEGVFAMICIVFVLRCKEICLDGKQDRVSALSNHVYMMDQHMSAFDFYFDHDLDRFYSLWNINIHYVVLAFVSFPYPFTIFNLAVKPFSACEASVPFHPIQWLGT